MSDTGVYNESIDMIKRVVGLPGDHIEYKDQTIYIYGEAVKKTFLSPIRIYALVEFTRFETEYMAGAGVDKVWEINIHFHKRRLEEDQDMYVREGDFVLYGDSYYEIVKLSYDKQLFGQINHIFEISAICKRARKGLFDAT